MEVEIIAVVSDCRLIAVISNFEAGLKLWIGINLVASTMTILASALISLSWQ